MKSPALVILSAFLIPVLTLAEDRLVIGAEGKRSVSIVDPADGNRVLWQYPLSGPVHILHLLPDFSLLTQDGWRNIIQLDLEKNVVWSYDADSMTRSEKIKRLEVHAAQRLPNGNTMIAESGASRILEVTEDGELFKEFPLQVTTPNGHSDTRQVNQLENGHYLVAHEADQIVKEYNSSGEVVWEFPIPLFGKEPARGHGPEAFGGRCFSAIRANNGNYLIATGNGHSVLEVTPEKEIVWKLEQNDLEGITLAWVTTLQEKANGNLILGNCHAGPDNPQIIEITRDKEVVWSFTDFETFNNALAVTVIVEGEQARELRSRLAVLANSTQP
ncbi:MAG: hypothetical protein AAGA96_05940 [Verrucomicrobiota bacterium]